MQSPVTLDSLLALRASGAVPVLAGGTDFYPALGEQAPPAEVVDICQVAELKGISETEDGWRIGAATTWTDLINCPLPPAFNALKAAAREVGSVQIQNAATLAGNLCNASPAADGVPPLLCLDASIELASASASRRLPLSEFILGVRKTALRPDELLTAIHIPRQADASVSSTASSTASTSVSSSVSNSVSSSTSSSASTSASSSASASASSSANSSESNSASCFGKLGARRYLVISIAMIAVNLRVSEQRIDSVKIAVGACSPVASRLPTLEARLNGRHIDELDIPGIVQSIDLDGLAPIDDVRASAHYRRQSVRELLQRLVAECIQQATAGSDANLNGGSKPEHTS